MVVWMHAQMENRERHVMGRIDEQIMGVEYKEGRMQKGVVQK